MNMNPGGSSKKRNNKIFSIVSLFSGAGGMDLGFENAGFKTIWANDIDRDSCTTHLHWSKSDVIHGDVSILNFSSIPKADVILGGFPCQGFSLAGPRKIDDKRNSLYRHFVKLVEEKKPYVFIAENVKGLLTLGDGKIISAIINDFSDKGYNVTYKLVNAADYNVPQDRLRVFMVGIRKDLPFNFSFPDKSLNRVTIQDAIGHLDLPNENDVCDAAYSSRYMSRNRRREWNDVSFTIPAMAKQVPLHPSSPLMIKIDKDLWSFGDNKITRRLSWQEAAMIQTFPEDFVFEGNLTSKYKQIGNAVPVKLAENVANNVYNYLIENL
jgi:DNA (cytosine-5)-methyltransferase 1